jgi:peptide/nickel transport system substrate-binding protein
MATLALLAIFAAACGSGPQGASVKEGGTLRIASIEYLDSTNPFTASTTIPAVMFSLTYPALIDVYPDHLDKLIPDFATRWEVSPDGLTYTFHTVPNAKWSDGQPLTAEDAAFTLNMAVKYKDTTTAYWAAFVEGIDTATATDPNTLVVKLKTPVANFLALTGPTSILPEHIWKSIEGTDGSGIGTYANAPPLVSGGPFIPTEYKKDEVLLFQRNPTYFGAKPHIAGFGIQFYGNLDAQLLALKNHEVDVMFGVDPTQVDSLKSSGFAVTPQTTTAWFYVGWNVNKDKPKNTELLDPQVRLALVHAIDEDAIIKTAFLGYAAPATGSILSPAWGSLVDPAAPKISYDINLANQMLDQLGYAKGPDGVRIANGHRMEYQFVRPDQMKGAGDRVLYIPKAVGAQVWVVIDKEPLDNNAAFTAITDPNGQILKFDMDMWAWGPRLDVGANFQVFTCASAGVLSEIKWCNSAYDQLYNEQLGIADPAKRKAVLYQMQEMLHQFIPYWVYAFPDEIEAHDKKWVIPENLDYPFEGPQTYAQIHLA